MSVIIGWLVLGLVGGLFLLGLVVSLRCGAADPAPGTRVMLVLLRLAIGWHFFIEGMEKLHDPNWSSAAYLREATGPLGPRFRSLAGDPLVESLTVADDKISGTLDQDWNDYFDAFQKFYHLDAEQTSRAREALDQVKKETAQFLSRGKKEVVKIAAYPPALTQAKTMPERLEEYAALKAKSDEIERDDLPRYGSAAFPAWKTAKADANRWRGELQKDLALVNKKMQRALRDVLFAILDSKLPAEKREKILAANLKLREQTAKEIAKSPQDWDAVQKLEDGRDDKLLDAYRAVFLPDREGNDIQVSLIRDNILQKRGKDQPSFDPLPFPVTRPWQQWTMLDWSDHIVKYGLAAVGLMLLLGVATRPACLAGAAFLLLFFLAMPPLPGWPDSPRVEGHYLYINKNVIEMLALLALATTRSGRWSGLDGLLQFINPWRKPQPR